jgi:hypothetical protein
MPSNPTVMIESYNLPADIRSWRNVDLPSEVEDPFSFRPLGRADGLCGSGLQCFCCSAYRIFEFSISCLPSDELEQLPFLSFHLHSFQGSNHKEVGGEQGDVSVVIRAATVIHTSAESVRLTHGLSRSVVHHKVEPGHHKRPSSLPAVKLFSRHEVLKVLVISPDFYLVRCSF